MRAFSYAATCALFLLAVPPGLARDPAPDLSVITDTLNAPDPRAAPELQQMAFLIGDWDLATHYAYSGQSYDSPGRLTARWALGGFGIATEDVHENGSEAGGPPFIANALYTIHPASRAITGFAINTLGNRKQLSGETVDGQLLLVQSGEMFTGGNEITRSVYTPTGPHSFTMLQQVSTDQGESWRDNGYRLEATRRR